MRQRNQERAKQRQLKDGAPLLSCTCFFRLLSKHTHVFVEKLFILFLFPASKLVEGGWGKRVSRECDGKKARREKEERKTNKKCWMKNMARRWAGRKSMGLSLDGLAKFPIKMKKKMAFSIAATFFGPGKALTGECEDGWEIRMWNLRN